MKNFFVALTLLFAVSLSAQTSSKEKKIHQLLELTGSAKIGVQVIGQMSNSFKSMYPNVPDTFWDEFMNEVSTEGLVDIIVPIYDKHYTEEEIDQLIVFYKSPIGRKAISEMPHIIQESMAAGNKWGQEISARVLENMKKKGYIGE